MSDLNQRRKGSHYEDRAAQYLAERNYTVLERNYRIRSGEIDLIAYDNLKRTLCFVEVKYRKSDAYGFPSESVTYRKQQNIIRVSEYYLLMKKMTDVMRRYDVIEILGDQINHLENAFWG